MSNHWAQLLSQHLKHRGFNVESLNDHCVPAGACFTFFKRYNFSRIPICLLFLLRRLSRGTTFKEKNLHHANSFPLNVVP